MTKVWADFHCPYCYLGIARLKQAMEELGLHDAEISVRSYLLNPDTPPETDILITDYVVNQYDAKREIVRRQNALLERKGRVLGLEMDLEKARFSDMFPAHRLLQHMNTLGKGSAFFERAQRALFYEGQLLSDHETLIALAEEIGVPREETMGVLLSDRYKEEVLSDDREAREKEIDFVPYYEFADSNTMSGERTYEEYLAALRRAKKTL